uniref:HAT C-terminal dimerisation domain-containing protein n=1 Tax=Xiphophorus maculatus TaxID=8083 RepID=A0A3B5PYQ3_XIPMA
KRLQYFHNYEKIICNNHKVLTNVKFYFYLFSHKSVNKAVLNFIVHGLQPFSLVEQPAFQSLIRDLQPNCSIMKMPYIATTTDCWTARRRSFIGITAHWLDLSSFCWSCMHAHLNDVQLILLGGDENNNVTGEEDDEVEFIQVGTMMTEDDGLKYQLLKHLYCACHLFNLVDAKNANKAEAYKKSLTSAFSKCQALWNKTVRSTVAEEVVEEHCKLQLVQPNMTRWNSFYLAVERILRILKEQGEGALRAVCAALDVPVAFWVNTTKTNMQVLIGQIPCGKEIPMGWLLPTVNALISKLDKTRASLKLCKPLVDALQDGVKKQFGEMISDPDLVTATILHLRFKKSWTADEEDVKLGLSCIKEHLPEHKTPLQPTNPSSGSDQADFFSNMKHVHTQETTKQLDAYLPVHQVAYRELNIPGKTLRYVKVLPGCMHPVAQATHCQLFF